MISNEQSHDAFKSRNFLEVSYLLHFRNRLLVVLWQKVSLIKSS